MGWLGHSALAMATVLLYAALFDAVAATNISRCGASWLKLYTTYSAASS
ncbi:MAG: hypothetical protein M3Q27_03495 [Actinomycetota bacterium]|nr:hypothetical protein [Actinomycetota bacterium]